MSVESAPQKARPRPLREIGTVLGGTWPGRFFVAVTAVLVAAAVAESGGYDAVRRFNRYMNPAYYDNGVTNHPGYLEGFLNPPVEPAAEPAPEPKPFRRIRNSDIEIPPALPPLAVSPEYEVAQLEYDLITDDAFGPEFAASPQGRRVIEDFRAQVSGSVAS